MKTPLIPSISNKILFKNLYLLFLFVILSIGINPIIGLNGFPFNNRIEVIIFITLVFFLFNKNGLNITKTKQRIFYILFFAVFIIFFTFKPNYFQSCYSTSETPVASFEMNFTVKDSCQFSFEKIGDPNNTKDEYFLNFNVNPRNINGINNTNWNLNFFNQTGFNFYEKTYYGGENNLDIPLYWSENRRISFNQIKDNNNIEMYKYDFESIAFPTEPDRNWLAFSTIWTSRINSVYQGDIKVTYVGEGSINIGEKIVKLNPSYSKTSDVYIYVAEGDSLQINYFYRYNGLINSIPNIPYASFSLTNPSNDPISLFNSDTQVFFYYVNSVLFFSLTLIFLFLIGINKKNLLIYIITSFLFFYLFNNFGANYFDYFELIILAIILLSIFMGKDLQLRSYFFYILILSISSLKNLNFTNNNTLYAVGGSDPLKYESWAQQIIHFRSFQGGEDIFLYQPGYRYVLAISRTIFGDSHFSLVLFSRFLFLLLIFNIFIYLYKNFRINKFIFSIYYFLTYILISTYSSKLNLFSSLSEWPTWIIGLIIIMFLLRKTLSDSELIIMGLLLGLMFFIRENQLPGILFLLLVLAVKFKNLKKLYLLLTPMISFILLPFIHNYLFGGEFVLNQDIFISGYYYLSPLDLVFNFSESKEQLLFQVNYLFSNPFNDGVRIMAGTILPLAIWVTILLWLYSFLINKKSIKSFIYFLIPLSFLSPHIFYQVHTYYPRHIMQGYIFMICSIILLNIDTEKVDLNV